MNTSDLDFDLPPDRIAQHPAEPRDSARLMVLDRRSGTFEHHAFSDLPRFLEPGDVLARNASKVVPARLVGIREATGGRWEGLFLKVGDDGSWEMLSTTRGKPRPGEWLATTSGLRLRFESRGDGGVWRVRPEAPIGDPYPLLERHGEVPLPPYIRSGREGPGDRESYQTVYAAAPGSVAAPTAGLHFTAETFRALAGRGVDVVDLTLHVGIGTFRPIVADRVEDHTPHAEWFSLDPAAASRLDRARAEGRRVVAVGTTSARALETVADPATRRFAPRSGWTARYIVPGHRFAGIDALVTNFHLPRSSLLALVAAFAGLEPIRAAYAEAIRAGYRFYSYGDAMLIA